jgi:hypothetical protein
MTALNANSVRNKSVVNLVSNDIEPNTLALISEKHHKPSNI